MPVPLQILSILVVGGIASYTDVRWGVIRNSLTLPAAAAGLAAGYAWGGLAGLKDAFVGVAVGLVLGLVFFLCGYGAGDAKLSAVFGAIMGLEGIVRATVYCVLMEGAVALLILLARRQLVRSLRALAVWGAVVLSGAKARPPVLGTFPHAPWLTAGAMLAVMIR